MAKFDALPIDVACIILDNVKSGDDVFSLSRVTGPWRRLIAVQLTKDGNFFKRLLGLFMDDLSSVSLADDDHLPQCDKANKCMMRVARKYVALANGSRQSSRAAGLTRAALLTDASRWFKNFIQDYERHRQNFVSASQNASVGVWHCKQCANCDGYGGVYWDHALRHYRLYQLLVPYPVALSVGTCAGAFKKISSHRPRVHSLKKIRHYMRFLNNGYRIERGIADKKYSVKHNNGRRVADPWLTEEILAERQAQVEQSRKDSLKERAEHPEIDFTSFTPDDGRPLVIPEI